MSVLLDWAAARNEERAELGCHRLESLVSSTGNEPSLRCSFNRPGERFEIDRARPHGNPGEVTEKRCVRPVATLVSCDSGDLENRPNLVFVELELDGWKSRHGGDHITRLVQPRVHPAILS